MFEKFKNIFKNSQSQVKRQPQLRRHKAYLAGESNKSTFSWTSYKHSSDEIIQKYFQMLVARSCEQCMNNPYARRFLLMLQNNVIGVNGILLRAQSKDLNGNLDEVANKAIEQAWSEWGKNCEITGKFDFVQLQKLIIMTAPREGEALIRMIKGKNAGPWGFAIQLIDARRLDFNKNEANVNGGNFIRFGIEFNPYGKPVNYYISKEYADLYYHTGDKHEIIPASEIIHGFLPEYIDQKRGLPWFSTVLMRMNMLAGFEEAAVEHARAGACQMGFFKNNDPESYDAAEDTPDFDIEAKPASFGVIPDGYELQNFNPSYPNGEFDVFSKSILRGIASGIGASYNSLANDLTSVNFSSLRQGALDERDSYMCLQKWVQTTFLTPIFEEWLKYSLLANKIKVKNGYLPAEKIAKYRNIDWQPRRWSWVDPVKDVNAAITSISAGLRSRSSVIKDQGLEPEDVWTEIEKENKILRSKNILVKDEVIKDVSNAGEN